MSYRKKLIEVALPLDAINKASAREKSIRHGHPSTLHLWWARRPLAAARAVIFGQMVDDPSTYVDSLLDLPETRRAAEQELEKRRELWQTRRTAYEGATGSEEVAVREPGPEPRLEECAADIERQRLFDIIDDLVQWENTTNESVLEKARAEIWLSWRRACADHADHPRAKELFDPNELPAFHDPFAGGGALPLEAQRLGLESYASDLNPVAVLINKAMIEIPLKFAGRPPVNPRTRSEKSLDPRQWRGAEGIAEDMRYYGQWMRDKAEKRIGHLYPKVEVTTKMAQERPDLNKYVGKKLTVIAWLWVRTVKSPNPAFAQIHVPLASTFMLSTKAAKQCYVEPIIENDGYRFSVKVGAPTDIDAAKNGTKLSRGTNFGCLMSGTPIAGTFIKAEAQAGRMNVRLMAIVVEGQRERLYLSPTAEMEEIALQAKPEWKPETPLPTKALGFSVQLYFDQGTYGDLFTPRQLVGLTTFSDLVREAHEQIKEDALAAGLPAGEHRLDAGGSGASAYADAVATYLTFALSKSVDGSSAICRWMVQRDSLFSTFSRPALAMTWDFAEVNLLADCTRSFSESITWTAESIAGIAAGYGSNFGVGRQLNATNQSLSLSKIVSTDPPYYDNIGYADLSDFFYPWLRRSLKPIFPELFETLSVPKTEELIASPHLHGTKEKAEKFFLNGMMHAMQRIAEQAHSGFPVTIYYAFRQSETESDGTASTGWETFLDAVVSAGFSLCGTWPMRTERQGRSRELGSNALASSIILVCRARAESAPTATRREFVTALKVELSQALVHLERSNIAPVDLAQAAIGPGMAVYTGYAKVLDAEGKPLSVRQALALINQTLDEALAEQEGDFDADSRWAVTWFEQSGFAQGDFGVAEQLSKSKNTSVAGMVQAGILSSKGGKVRLLKPEELPADWNPDTDPRLTAWEVVHQLIRSLEAGGEGAAAGLVAKLGTKAEIARELAYRLYTVCERKKRAAEALSYNGLVQSWPEITRLSREETTARPTQPQLI